MVCGLGSGQQGDMEGLSAEGGRDERAMVRGWRKGRKAKHDGE